MDKKAPQMFHVEHLGRNGQLRREWVVRPEAGREEAAGPGGCGRDGSGRPGQEWAAGAGVGGRGGSEPPGRE